MPEITTNIYGVLTGSIRSPSGVRSGSVWDPFSVCARFLRRPYGVRSVRKLSNLKTVFDRWRTR